MKNSFAPAEFMKYALIADNAVTFNASGEKINGNVALMGGHYKYTDYNEKYAGRIGDNESTTIKEEYGSRMCLYL